MALVTIQRSPSPSNDPDSESGDVVDGGDGGSGRSPLRQRSLSESYFTIKGAALILPQREFVGKKNNRKQHGGDIQYDLQAMLYLLRPEDKIRVAIKLESTEEKHHRYMAVVMAMGRQDTEETIILGIDCFEKDTAIGLVIPVYRGTKVTLDGDGGFSVHADDRQYIFKPVSVQAMWSALQSLDRAIHQAEEKTYIPGGLTHTWMGYYQSKVDHSSRNCLSLWHAMEGVESTAATRIDPVHFGNEDKMKLSISSALRDVMMTVDLDEATSKSLRLEVEKCLGVSLTPYREYFDQEVLRILGQMDAPSEILDYLYLGSEWNASNLDELREKGIGYILNITREIDNFFTGTFQYMNVRVYDNLEAKLLEHWEKTFRFIDKARKHNSKVLVHCKMGISRSASTVTAFLMKEKRWTAEEALQFVKKHRSCARPNDNFMRQLETYEGILKASRQRDRFRSQQEAALGQVSEGSGEEDQDNSFYLESIMPLQGSASESEDSHPLQVPSNSAGEDMLQMESDLETGSRSADSMEESFPDIPSPTPELQDAPSLHPLLPPARGESSCGEERAQGGPAVALGEVSASCLAEMESSALEMSEPEGNMALWGSASAQATAVRIRPDDSWIKPDSLSPLATSDAPTSPEGGAIPCPQVAPSLKEPTLPPVQPPTPAVPTPTSAAAQDKTPVGHTVSAPPAMEASPLSCSPRMSTGSLGDLEDSEMPLTSPSSLVQYIGITQYYAREKIPWHLGTVKKLTAEIDKTKQLSQGEEEEMDCSAAPLERGEGEEKVAADVQMLSENTAASKPECAAIVPSSAVVPVQLQQYQQQQQQQQLQQRQQQQQQEQPMQQQPLQKAPSSPQQQQQQLQEPLQSSPQQQQQQQQQQHPQDEQLQASGSGSSPELRTVERTSETPTSSSRPQSVYEKEDIPLTPGMVQRTRQEIEERQKMDDSLGLRPVQRSASLKEGRESQRCRHAERRKTCTPILSPSTLSPNTPTTTSPTATSPTLSAASLLPLLPLERIPISLDQADEEVGKEAAAQAQQDVAVIKLGNEEFPLEVGKVKRHKKDFEHKSDDLKPRAVETPGTTSACDQGSSKRESPSHRVPQASLPTPSPLFIPGRTTPSPDPHLPPRLRMDKSTPKAEETVVLDVSIQKTEGGSSRVDSTSPKWTDSFGPKSESSPRAEELSQAGACGFWVDKSRSKSEPTTCRPKDSAGSQSKTPRKTDAAGQTRWKNDRNGARTESTDPRQTESRGASRSDSIKRGGGVDQFLHSVKKSEQIKGRFGEAAGDSHGLKGDQGRAVEPCPVVWRVDRGGPRSDTAGLRVVGSSDAKSFPAKHQPVFSQPWPGLEPSGTETAPHLGHGRPSCTPSHSSGSAEAGKPQSLQRWTESAMPGAQDLRGSGWRNGSSASLGPAAGDLLGFSSSHTCHGRDAGADKHRHVVNKKMLDMIRKIGSELTLGPEKADEEERKRPCTSQVKSLVRKMEQNSPDQRPPFKVVIIDRESSPQPQSKAAVPVSQTWDGSLQDARSSSFSESRTVRASSWTPSDPLNIPRRGAAGQHAAASGHQTSGQRLESDRPSSLNLVELREGDSGSAVSPPASMLASSNQGLTPSPTRLAASDLDASVVRHLVGRFEKRDSTPCPEPGKRFSLSPSWENSGQGMAGDPQLPRLSSSVDENAMRGQTLAQAHRTAFRSVRPQSADHMHGGQGSPPRPLGFLQSVSQDAEMEEVRSVSGHSGRLGVAPGGAGFQPLPIQPRDVSGPPQPFMRSPFYNTM